MKTRMIMACLCLLAVSGCNLGSSSGSGGGASSASASLDSSSSASSSSEPGGTADVPPNILFIVMDDLGVDQLAAFGYGGTIPPQTDSIDAIASAGVRFRNTWSMPTCSPTRSTFYEGRYPFRSGVRNAVLSADLANSQVSPYTLTTPKLLREEANYVNALIGKMHLTGSDLNPDNHPLGDEAMRELGWDYFAGYLDGAPYPIDTTAGGVAPAGTYHCGFVPTTLIDPDQGADTGVCYLPEGSESTHLVMDDPEDYPTPGRTCLELGGILDPGATEYSDTRRAALNFNTQNGHYTGEWKINLADGTNQTVHASDARARGYRAILETDAAIATITRIREQHPDRPWMVSLGYSALHTPLQPPPAALLPHPDAALSLVGCGTPVASALTELGILPQESLDLAEFTQQRAVAQHMLEAMDHEIGRLLVTAGIAERLEDGSLQYNPDSNTVVIIVSDNGTYMPTVKLPFDPLRAKGSLYQTGVWVPLIVAGPPAVVSNPDRDVEHMVNTTDLYSLFREIAGIDEGRLPESWRGQLDAQPVLPYLTEPGRDAIRTTNFTEQGVNFSVDTPPPCVIPAANTCVQIFTQKGVCEDQSGVWYGAGSDIAGVPEGGFGSCCAVNAWFEDNGGEAVQVFPSHQAALRDDQYKLVRITRPYCDNGVEAGSTATEEFYEINQSRDTAELKLDREELNLLADKTPDDLTPEQRDSFTALSSALTDLLNSGIDCPGDGNGDLVVDEQDQAEWAYWADPEQGGGLSSWYDFNRDGLTDAADGEIILANMGNDCRP
ncbi:sulfatase-like hydrolase/transferase [Cellvibrio japonicus]|uniref:Putative lipoprotein n=1 Tax=Cellvibrio japonicus (strain Ueda107) TaxID=498211 RepID=B3PDX0_CELJU|nr:sulfatase-like hydrolase/transferase [Cellvibrio japonicus]ACE85666.1 putative lipoprotein [Cellvibrio japonicus Ueda107]QEI13453.1 sulfatase-like hydrolase/transferase [Cellvibrio japonicus]QEI17027.1 sulfatase-like hydrolase/transferase [Cellvibrio japonicus]QEI20605.1 sulfatase-like hydrolase/transferase [Cellvibrio japonicus]